MNEADALEVVRNALWTVIIASGPAVVAAMVIGVAIALFQALTQVQEVTLTFVPKILAVIFVVTVAAPFIGLIYAVLLPFVGIAMIAKTGYDAYRA